MNSFNRFELGSITNNVKFTFKFSCADWIVSNFCKVCKFSFVTKSPPPLYKHYSTSILLVYEHLINVKRCLLPRGIWVARTSCDMRTSTVSTCRSSSQSPDLEQVSTCRHRDQLIRVELERPFCLVKSL